MFRIAKSMTTLALFSILALFPGRARSDEDAMNRRQREENAAALRVAEIAKRADVRVLLAVTEGYETTKSPLHVIIENLTDKPQSHFEEWNSWGYGNLTAEWTSADGKTGTVIKVPGAWYRNGPSTITLQPGEALVREISFDSKLWEAGRTYPTGVGSP